MVGLMVLTMVESREFECRCEHKQHAALFSPGQGPVSYKKYESAHPPTLDKNSEIERNCLTMSKSKTPPTPPPTVYR
jgi:hypothetical protein